MAISDIQGTKNIGHYRTKPAKMGQYRTNQGKLQNIGQYRNIGHCGRPVRPTMYGDHQNKNKEYH